ncbi:DUF305 domain-containing protein [Streptosporangium roseum]|uniref:DUF305 domain-containing protein n=1 Tax=Streptosporangium roseum TaxID=2001 RepID=UPI003324C9DB
MDMDTSVERPARSRLPLLILAILTSIVAAASLLALGNSQPPSDSSPEAGFARDMAVHHAQAVEMSFIMRDASPDEPLRVLTYDIIVTQTAQRGIFMGWLQQWGLNQSGERPVMAWMAGHGHGATAPASATMPGMAGEEELKRLREATGEEQETLFLQLMIRHHEGGVQMSQALLKLSDRDEVASMAGHIVNAQAGEIKLMTDMLRQRGAQPLPSILK